MTTMLAVMLMMVLIMTFVTMGVQASPGSEMVRCTDDKPLCVGPRCSAISGGHFSPKFQDWAPGMIMEHPRNCDTCECRKLPSKTKSGTVTDDIATAQKGSEIALSNWHTHLCRSCPYSCRYLMLNSLLSPKSTPKDKRVILRRYVRNVTLLDNATRAASAPNAIVIGVQKGGTTEFWNRLTSYSVEFPKARKKGGKETKELHFLDHCFGIDEPPSALSEELALSAPASTTWCGVAGYLDMFENGRTTKQKILAHQGEKQPKTMYLTEASPSYILLPHMAAFTNALFPKTKVLAIIREPVARSFSGYHQSLTAYKRGNQEPEGRVDYVPFAIAIEPEIKIIRHCERVFPDATIRFDKCIWPMFSALSLSTSLDEETYVGPHEHEFNAQPRRCSAGLLRKHSLVIRGMYYYQLKAWIDELGPERVHVMLSEDYFKDPDVVVSEAAAFIAHGKRKPQIPADAFGRNSASHGKIMDDVTKSLLQSLYRPYNALLVNLLQKHKFPTPQWIY
eukprot:m.163615 g.163615  ORF g.163615 m.163615 type:complete len:507 (-) comp31298_c0_seq4:286-1806(-)